MRLINKYLTKEIFSSLLGVAAVLLLILISGQLVSLYSKAASGAVPVDTILIVLGLKSLSNIAIVLPLAFYLAVLLAFSRLYRDNEMAVLAACGIGQWRLLRPVLKLTFFFAIFIGALTLYVSPWALDKTRQLVQISESKTDIKAIGTGKFQETPSGEGVIYIEETKEGSEELQNIFIQQKSENSNSIISSSSGQQVTDEKTGIRYLILENGYRYDGQLGKGEYVEIRFKKHGIRLTDQELLSANRRHKEISTYELWNTWERHDVAELQWRISTVLLCIILAILALPLSKTSSRQGKYTKVGLALLIYIIYTNLLNASRVWIERGEIPYSIGLWWVHAIMLVIAMSFYIQPVYFKRLVSRKRSVH
ncbi:MAG: LPS export ABC transporter permease LptF [Gammaproteobacteria bacterium]|nr:LPS export ABC transporter permease LptF [Gammaproteobacteria bacterium]